MEEYREDILGGTAVIRVEAKKAAGSWDGDQLYGEQGVSFEECMLTFVPYAYWGNRETGEMLVWIKELF